MRFSRLDLVRYGRFTDHRIDFGPAEPGAPDLHVVYGPNEAGKSTALAAILDLLFGIEARSPYDFLHPYATMAIGATVEAGGVAHEYVRLKRNAASLLGPSGQPADEGALSAALSNIGRDRFREMFSMDDDTLEAGGEGILASKGDLGRLLFSASAGLAELSERLDAARDEADAFTKARARNSELAALKARLAELKAQKDDLDVAAGRHAQLVAARDQASRGYEEALAARSEGQALSAALRRRLDALPRVASLRALRDQIQDIGDVPEAPASWTDEVAGLRERTVRTATLQEANDAALARLEKEAAGTVVDDAALAAAGHLDRLAELRPRHVTAEKDLPDRRAQLGAAEIAVAGALRRLGRSGEADPARLVPDAATAGILRDLIESRSGIEEALRIARSEAAGALRLADEAKAALPDASGGRAGGGEGVGRVEAALAAAQASDAPGRLRAAERSRAVAAGDLADRLLALRPWEGGADELAGAPVPDEAELERWREGLAEAHARAGQADADAESAAAEARRSQAELDAAAAVAGLLPAQDAARVRSDRERAWAHHRHVLDAPSADDFEAALRADDAVTAARIGHQADLARLRSAHEAVAAAAEAVRAAGLAKAAALGEAAALRAEVEAAAAAIGPALAALPLPRLEAWLARRLTALDVRERVRSSELDLSEASGEVDALRARLSAALAAVAPAVPSSDGLDELRAAADAVVAREKELGAQRSRAADLESEATRRRHDLDQALATERRWGEAWDAACARCWIGEGGVRRTPPEVRGLLEAAAELAPALERKAGLADRIAKMELDRQAFSDAVASAAAAVPSLDASGTPSEAARRLEAAVRGAQEQAKALAALSVEVEEAVGERERLAQAAASDRRRVEEMGALLGAATLDGIEGRLRALDRRAGLVEQVRTAEQEITAALGSAGIAEAEAFLDGIDRQGLEAELAAAEVRFGDHDQRTRDSFAALRGAEEKLEAIGGDDAVARLAEARRTTLLEVTEGAIRYLRLRAGIAAAEQALRLYRERHRSSMLAAASDVFHLISRGRYRLTSRPEKDGEALIAVATAGGSKAADELSKGTRFQLYLALRVAAFGEFARTQAPLPFIADDIMETFDDERAEAAFRALAGMAATGQVIYLTHHPHICRIARAVCPTVEIHELEPLPVEARPSEATATPAVLSRP